MVVDILEILWNCIQLSFNTLKVIQQLSRSNNSVKPIYPESKQLGQQTSNSPKLLNPKAYDYENLIQGRLVSYLQLCS